MTPVDHDAARKLAESILSLSKADAHTFGNIDEIVHTARKLARAYLDLPRWRPTDQDLNDLVPLISAYLRNWFASHYVDDDENSGIHLDEDVIADALVADVVAPAILALTPPPPQEAPHG